MFKQLKTYGFGHFVGIDGSDGMLELARSSGLYQELKQSILGEEPLPAPCGNLMIITHWLLIFVIEFVIKWIM